MIDASAAAGGITLSVAQVSNTGGRKSNEDALGSAQRGDLACFVISDGAGGHEGGEIASRIVVQSIVAAFGREITFAGAQLPSWIALAAADVASGKAGVEHLQEMSATVAAVLVDKKHGQAAWVHLGDTRVYLFRARRLLHVTKDHSMVQQFIDAGLAGGADTRTHPKRNMLYAAIGAECDAQPAVQAPLALQDGDAILICTDGLWEWVTEDVMERTLGATGDSHEWLAAMCAAADEASATSGKARDNFTAQALWVHTGHAES